MKRGTRAWVLAACTLAAMHVLLVLLPASAFAALTARSARILPAGASGTRSPNRAPLLGSGTASATSTGSEESQGATVEGEADPLVSNGLGSPTCKGPLAGELAPASRSHCETSGFIAAPAPTGDYGIDVHIDTGLLGFSAGGLSSAVQDLLVSPFWNMLVWLTHALVVMLEWCFTIELLDSPAAGGLASGLRRAQASFTEPWLVLVLALASVFAVYQGLIRRRVADTLGELLVMAAMMVAGLWIMADPMGSVGVLGEWANRASLGTMAVAASGTPSTPARALGNSLDTVFAVAIEAPWCYMEFGSVAWCREPSRLQPDLHAAGLAISAQELSLAGCSSSSACAAAGTEAQALQRSADLLRQAPSNGAIFLALPANGPVRNSINDTGSLLRTICQSDQATDCHGPAAAEAEFRTGAHTWERASGLLLIAAGLLGMLLLFGFLALRLLVAAIFSLLYLMLTPAVVLAPAFGESGRALFRRWALQLLGAVVSKLLFSFLLGAALAVLTVLSELTALGWWTQWLLMSAFWWATFTRRHQALSVLAGASSAGQVPRDSMMRVAKRALLKRNVNDTYDRVKRRFERPPEAAPAREKAERERPQDTKLETRVASQSTRALEADYRYANGRSKRSAQTAHRISELHARLGRVRDEQSKALNGGDPRRAARLEHRGARIASEIEREQVGLDAAKRITTSSAGAFLRAGREERERSLDAQATLPSSAHRQRTKDGRRDYPALAGILGYAPAEYERLGPRTQRAARLEIDRELALRNDLGRRLGNTQPGNDGPTRSEQPQPRRGRASPRTDSAREQIDPELIRAARESPIMRDAREVQEGRKRQLGRGLP